MVQNFLVLSCQPALSLFWIYELGWILSGFDTFQSTHYIITGTALVMKVNALDIHTKFVKRMRWSVRHAVLGWWFKLLLYTLQDCLDTDYWLNMFCIVPVYVFRTLRRLHCLPYPLRLSYSMTPIHLAWIQWEMLVCACCLFNVFLLLVYFCVYFPVSLSLSISVSVTLSSILSLSLSLSPSLPFYSIDLASSKEQTHFH